MTPQGHPRARFRRAIEGRWVFHAELAAREAGNLTLTESLELVCLYADAEPAKFERAALRWHARFVTESADYCSVRRSRWPRSRSSVREANRAKKLLVELARG